MKSHLQGLLLAGITTLGFKFCYAIDPPESLKIAEAGKPLADIVVDKNASSQLKKAAESLRIYLQKSTGADFSINESPKQGASIYVGMTPEIAKTNIDVSALDHDGFILQGVDRNSYVILGGSDTVQAVVAGLLDSSTEGIRQQDARWRSTVRERPDTVVASVSGEATRGCLAALTELSW